MLTVLTIVASGGLVVFGWFLRTFFPSYLDQKAKNLATKEDIAEITKQVEQVKAAVGSRLHIHQVRYEHEFKILLELSEKLVAARDAALGLRPEVSYGDPNDPEMKKKRIGQYIDAARELYTFRETRQPFFPEDIYGVMKAFDHATWREFVQYKNQVPADAVKYWDNALKNGAEIATLAEAGLLRIRERSRRWEAFDPAPGGFPTALQ